MASPTLFDLAVNRAHRYARSLALDVQDAPALERGLELWYLKTRFAYRVPLGAVVQALASSPGADHAWTGGPGGGWVRGKPPTP